MTSDSMTGTERRASFSLAGIFSLRMLGLFMIYPVFAVFAHKLPDATPTSIGLALGIYGLSQALFQIPLGMLSDRVGRKPVIAGGLVVFAIGSVLAAVSGSIYGIILGRLLQGCGAVGSTILALGADLTREQHRTKAMAVIGMTIGLSFVVAMVVGPVLNGWIGVPGIFWLTAVLAGLGILVLYATVPTPVESHLQREAEAVPALFRRVLTDPQLLRLDFGIFAQHAILTASFLAVPILLVRSGLHVGAEWYFYLPLLLASVVVMVPCIIIAERGRMKGFFLGGVIAIGLSQLILLFAGGHLALVALGVLVFFSAFNFLEASLPSLISRMAPAESRGTAMGIYSSCQFFDMFVGGVGAGGVQSVWGLPGVFGFGLVIAALWALVSWSLKVPTRARRGAADPQAA
ncbi:MAG: MFS transporter [Gammaproteobacteria bacterium]